MYYTSNCVFNNNKSFVQPLNSFKLHKYQNLNKLNPILTAVDICLNAMKEKLGRGRIEFADA